MLKRLWKWLLGQTTIDEKIEEKVDNAKRTVVAVKEEVIDIKEAVQEAIENISEEVEDVVELVQTGVVIEGKVTKSKLRELKKADLLKHAEETFETSFDPKLNKTNLVNKVYELHHKK